MRLKWGNMLEFRPSTVVRCASFCFLSNFFSLMVKRAIHNGSLWILIARLCWIKSRSNSKEAFRVHCVFWKRGCSRLTILRKSLSFTRMTIIPIRFLLLLFWTNLFVCGQVDIHNLIANDLKFYKSFLFSSRSSLSNKLIRFLIIDCVSKKIPTCLAALSSIIYSFMGILITPKTSCSWSSPNQ